jgi:hypothetical protein
MWSLTSRHERLRWWSDEVFDDWFGRRSALAAGLVVIAVFLVDMHRLAGALDR